MEYHPDPTQQEYSRTFTLCQQILRVTTGVILAAFVSIIAMTTVSTGPFVQTVGKLLYYVIVLAALVSLGTWFYRTRLAKRQLPKGR
jgi:hypothetical protein